MADSTTFNIQHQERLSDILSVCPVKYERSEHFNSFDWNVTVRNIDADAFTDWCEEHEVKCEMV